MAGCSKSTSETSTSAVRVISFAPSITETLYALSLGDKIVGVTRYCTYPPKVKQKPKVGGYIDPHYELILGLKPDLVLLLKEHETLRSFLEKKSIRYITIDNEGVEGILGSFRVIGAACGEEKRGDTLVSRVRDQLKNEHIGTFRPKILLCIGRNNPGTGTIGKIYIAGPKTFYSELIDLAGAQNVMSDSGLVYPTLSTESVIRMAPDIIIDLMASVSDIAPEEIEKDWGQLTMVPAVQNGDVYCLTGDYMSVPGPRISLIFKDLKGIVDKWHEKGECRDE